MWRCVLRTQSGCFRFIGGEGTVDLLRIPSFRSVGERRLAASTDWHVQLGLRRMGWDGAVLVASAWATAGSPENEDDRIRLTGRDAEHAMARLVDVRDAGPIAYSQDFCGLIRNYKQQR